MSRMGFELSEAENLSQYFKNSKRFKLGGVATHLLNGEDYGVEDGASSKQLMAFEKVATLFRGVNFHYLNSSAIITRPDTKAGARPGIALYGSMPPTHDKIRADLQPAMTWRSSVAVVRKIKAGATVSYGGTWTAKRESIIATIPVGYGDGYPRALSNRGIMLFRGQRVPVTGIVCMDYTMIDVTDACKEAVARAGEEVVLLGGQENEKIKVEELAQLAGTITYEIMTRIGPRVPRLYTHLVRETHDGHQIFNGRDDFRRTNDDPSGRKRHGI